jgi:SAM-dependent methyltransferase
MVEKDAVRRGYDGLADAYAASRSGGGMDELAGFLDGLSGGSPSDTPRVLDAGCGQGTPVLSGLSASTRAVGLDFAWEQLALAEVNAPGAALVQGDMTALPFADDAFDAVVAYWSLIHVPGEAHRTVLGEFARVLAPGGQLLLNEGASAWTGENPDWLDTGVEMQWSIAGADATREQLRDAGFVIVEEWGAPDTLEDGDAGDEGSAGDGESGDGDPWVFFAARLDGQ